MRKRQVVVIGENLVDVIVMDHGPPAVVPGGGPFNVARTIARLGQTSVLLSGMSNDAYGAMLRTVLKSDGVTLFPRVCVELPTSLARVSVTNGSPDYEFTLERTASFAIDSKTAHEVMAQLDDVGAISIGTLGLLVEPMASTCEQLVLEASSTTLVFLDPNCRPSAVLDRKTYVERLERLYPRCDVVKFSSEDLTFLMPGATPLDAARDVVAKGPMCVIVSDGPGLVWFVTPNALRSTQVPIVDVLDTVGAGDALVGAFIAWWIGHGLDRANLANEVFIKAAVEAAVVVASATCTRRGAQPPWASELADEPAWQWV